MSELVYKKKRKSRIDLTGKRFGRLTVLEYAGTGKSGTFWKCKCDCGKITTILSHSLRSGRTKSCGCYNREVTSKRNCNLLKQIERLQEQLDIVTEQRDDIHIDKQVLQKQLHEANEVIESLRTYDFTVDDENAEAYQVKWNIKAERFYKNRKWGVK